MLSQPRRQGGTEAWQGDIHWRHRPLEGEPATAVDAVLERGQGACSFPRSDLMCACVPPAGVMGLGSGSERGLLFFPSGLSVLVRNTVLLVSGGAGLPGLQALTV